MLAAATASWTARLIPPPPIGDIAWAASPMHNSPGRYHLRKRSTRTVRSLISLQSPSSPTWSRAVSWSWNGNEAAMRLYQRTNFLIIIDCDSNARKGQRPMKFMIIVKASKASEAGEMPSTELLTAMGNYNEELSKAGILLAAEGLHPSSKGARVRFSGKDRTVTDGPFAEP